MFSCTNNSHGRFIRYEYGVIKYSTVHDTFIVVNKDRNVKDYSKLGALIIEAYKLKESLTSKEKIN